MLNFLIEIELNKFIINSYYKFERNDVESDTETEDDVENNVENTNENATESSPLESKKEESEIKIENTTESSPLELEEEESITKIENDIENNIKSDSLESFLIKADEGDETKTDSINLDEDIEENVEENLNDIEIDFISYRQTIAEFVIFLKLNSIFQFNSISDIIVIDNINHKFRFNIIYHLQSSINNAIIRIITKVNNVLPLISLCQIFPACNWLEREIWDMFGIFFIKHSDLRRILTDYGFIGHPLKKDFPTTGYKELIYYEELKHPLYINVELMQNLRIIQMNNNWLINEKTF